MVGGYGMDHPIRFTVSFGQIGPDDRVGSFHLMVDRLADVVQQPGPLSLFHIQSQFRGHGAAKKSHFQGVLQYVLPITGPVFQFSDEFDQFRD